MNLFLNIIITLTAVGATLYLFKKDLELSLLSLLLIVQYIWMFFSISFIETGIYINEQNRDGYFVYAGLVLLLFYLSSLMALIVYKKIISTILKKTVVPKFRLSPFSDASLSMILIGLVLFLAYFNLLSSPIPLITKDVSKFNFWEHAKYPFLKPLVGNVMSFVGFGAVLYFFKNKKISILYLILYFVYLVLIGQKFTGFYFALFGMSIAYYIASKKKIKFKIKWVFNKYTITLAGCLFGLVWYKYSIKNPFEYIGMTPLESVFYRTFGLQGHVFWGATERYVYNNTPNTWDITELWKGMHHLMYEFWGFEREAFYRVTERGVSWTNAYPSILLRIFPLPIAIIANMILLFIVSLFQSLLSICIKRKAYLLSIVFFQSLIWVSYAYTMGYFNKLMIPIILLFMISPLFFLTLKKKDNDKTIKG